jgi:hypothetical protein
VEEGQMGRNSARNLSAHGGRAEVADGGCLRRLELSFIEGFVSADPVKPTACPHPARQATQFMSNHAGGQPG